MFSGASACVASNAMPKLFPLFLTLCSLLKILSLVLHGRVFVAYEMY